MIPITLLLADAASGAKTYDFALPPGKWRVKLAYFVPDNNGAVATDASNYRTITVKNGSTTLATATTNSTGGAAFVANTATTMTVSGGASREFTGGTDTLKVDSAYAGTGAVAKGIVCVMIEPMQPTAYPS